jgi:FkbM family methyltransferase
VGLIGKLILKLKIETRFLLEQKYAIKKPSDPYTISKSILKRYLNNNPVIIDCGAHVGADSIELAKLFPKGHVHSFEPVPDIFKHLKHNTRRFSNISTYQLALSNENGKSSMFVSSGDSDASSSLLMPTGHLKNHPDVYFNDTTEVRTLTLDSWAGENKIEKVDFLWLDMQGFEFKMLAASGGILEKVKAIHTEVSMNETYKGAPLYAEFRKWLEERGFRTAAEAIPAGTDMGNALFVRN